MQHPCHPGPTSQHTDSCSPRSTMTWAAVGLRARTLSTSAASACTSGWLLRHKRTAGATAPAEAMAACRAPLSAPTKYNATRHLSKWSWVELDLSRAVGHQSCADSIGIDGGSAHSKPDHAVLPWNKQVYTVLDHAAFTSGAGEQCLPARQFCNGSQHHDRPVE